MFHPRIQFIDVINYFIIHANNYECHVKRKTKQQQNKKVKFGILFRYYDSFEIFLS